MRSAARAYTAEMAPISRFLCASILVLAPAAAVAQATVSPLDARAVREVIEAQLDAFARDDAARAFSLATPGIREFFGTPEKFIDMVRRSYAVVYRPRSVLFESPVLVEGQVMQPVRLTDAEGRGWIAVYPMQRQPDGNWRTNGCQLGRLSGQQVRIPKPPAV